MHKNYITPVGHKRMVDELQQLNSVERPYVTQLVSVAAANGDRSENADYLYGKRRLREIDRRIRFLLKRMENMEVVDNSGKTFIKVQFGATVKIENEDGEEKTYTIVGIDEVDIHKGHISWKSPIGSSLLGKEEGDEVKIQTPGGVQMLTISEIVYFKIT